MDPEVLKNYRPISNLSFVSKLTEKNVAERLISHLQNKNLQEPLQSAYRKQCSTETALLKVQDDILKNLDKQKGVVLLLLDLSAAFDTVDHGTLINTLKNEDGVTGECLAWIQSHLEERQQRVIINNNNRSDSMTLKCGVPQGSVLGPLLFSIYTIPLAAIMRKHGILYHLYADDTQLSVSVYYVAVRTIVLSRHGSHLARPVIIHDIIHGLIYVPSTPYCGFFGVSPDGNCAYVH